MVNSANIDVLAVGVNVVDVLVRLPDGYTPGEKHTARGIAVAGGGPAATAACVTAMLGWRTGFVTRLGNDALSAFSLADFARHGVVPDFFIPDPQATPVVAVVQVDARTGERTIFYTRENYQPLRKEDVPLDAVRSAKLVLVDGYEPEAASLVLRAARDAGVRSVLDVEVGDPEATRELLKLSTDCILPLGQARALTGEKLPERVLQSLAKETAAQLVTTDGVRGSWALTPDGVLHQPAFPVETVDTTGCGDAFHGGYGAGVLTGLTLQARLELAAWVAAQVARGLGGRSHLPTHESLQRAARIELSSEIRTAVTDRPRT